MYCVDSSLSGGCLMECVLGVGLLGGIVIVCFVWGGWFVLIGPNFLVWGLYCRLECSCRSGSSLLDGGEWGWGWLLFLFLLVWCGCVFWVLGCWGV